jgi:hypothetical protein
MEIIKFGYLLIKIHGIIMMTLKIGNTIKAKLSSKTKVFYYDRKKVKCEICGKEMIRTSIYRHKRICL